MCADLFIKKPILHKESSAILFTFGSGVFSRLIRWQQRSSVSHAAIANGENVWEAIQGRGVIKRKFGEFKSENEGEFLVCPFTIHESSFALRMVDFLDRQVGKDYDWPSVIRFVTRDQDDRKGIGRWFCSELAHQAMLEAGLEPLARSSPCNTSPGLLFTSAQLTETISGYKWNNQVVEPARIARLRVGGNKC